MYLSLISAALCGLIVPQTVGAVPYALRRAVHDFTPRAQTPSQIQLDLGPQLSNGSTIYVQGDDEFTTATSRWNVYGQPNVSVVVEVASAADVVATVQYANQVGMQFITVNRGHGSTYTLGNVQGGIEIWVTKLDTVTISEDGNTAVVGGGSYVESMISALAEYGKASASGACGCVGIVGAGLGGGHGRLQGHFGLVVDNFIDIDLVLWNGTQISVSEESYPDLFWGLRSAGHNFGIVTSFTYKIYDEPSPVWFYGVYYFMENQLENIFEEMNRQSEATLPPEMGLLLLDYVWNTDISETEPVLVLSINYGGSADDAAPYVDAFKAFGPVSVEEGEAPYSQIANASGTDVDDPLCSHGTQRMQFAADLTTYNITTNRAVFELYKEKTVAQPLFRGTIVVFESYSLQGVQSVPSENTAYPHRDDNIIWTTVIQYDPNPDLDAEAIAWGEETRTLVHAGQASNATLNVYVNYAFGNETLPSMYGYEPWRLEKLRDLKRTWDPYGKFNYYMPIS
ncbi:uncharacterized protein BCR38DRAFT_475286 [Pseudomassariella vexata]|uniref:FAD-binding PCMH-type domain-containing protein n=1 Tax=Pseudomassariella vexata TaxID=1141098 RepID=A0A1Y2DVM2_9PEZI|nr:uncharacterized protein BCR38DRAFT_475286 [Pseudomassariella vexata]ORY63307.1 hypothetical protein BCR38DRAFT_475286 [Pseudomassariella vexata]